MPPDLKAPPKTAVRFRFSFSDSGEGRREAAPLLLQPGQAASFLLDHRWRSVRVHCQGGKPAVYILAHLIPGLHEGVLGMVVGEKRPTALAYGEKRGRRGVPNGNLVYDVKLLAIE